jgi:RimJ/RimL family protein N-acetyltransferase
MIRYKPEIALFFLAGYSVRRLKTLNAAELQDLYERCSDYHEMHEGFATRPSAGADELAMLPPGRSQEDKFSIGIYESTGPLIAYLDIVRGYPVENEWWIGLLMLDPEVRANGLGTRIFEAARDWAFSQGGQSIYLAVLEENKRAERFWRRQGFEEVRRQSHTSETGNKICQVIVMKYLTANERE